MPPSDESRDIEALWAMKVVSDDHRESTAEIFARPPEL